MFSSQSFPWFARHVCSKSFRNVESKDLQAESNGLHFFERVDSVVFSCDDSVVHESIAILI